MLLYDVNVVVVDDDDDDDDDAVLCRMLYGSVEMKWAIAVSVVVVVVIVVAVVVSCFSKYARLFYKHDSNSSGNPFHDTVTPDTR